MELNIKKIDKERERLGLSQKELAKALGMHYQGLDYICKRKSTNLRTIQAIADFFGIEGKDLII